MQVDFMDFDLEGKQHFIFYMRRKYEISPHIFHWITSMIGLKIWKRTNTCKICCDSFIRYYFGLHGWLTDGVFQKQSSERKKLERKIQNEKVNRSDKKSKRKSEKIKIGIDETGCLPSRTRKKCKTRYNI